MVLIVFLLFGCEDENKKAEAPPAALPEEKKNFFPVLDYLKGEVAYVDSFPLRIMTFSTRNGHTDSGYIQITEFDRLAREFLDPALDTASMEKDFTENSFLDQTSQSLTFTYSKKNGSAGIKRIDVLAAQDPAYDKVKSVYIEKVNTQNDTTVVKKMFWKPKRNFQVITIIQPPHQPDITNKLKVVWDDRP